MPLAAGTRLGPYEIAAALGAGGMCEVYRATDTRLSRSVANKVLPEALLGAGGIGEVYRAAIRSSVETSRSRFWLRPFMVAKDGRVKVLDFGLAKLREDAVQIWTRRSARCARSPAAGRSSAHGGVHVTGAGAASRTCATAASPSRTAPRPPALS